MPATPTVSVWPQNISVRPFVAPFEHADDVGPSAARPSTDDVEADAPHLGGDGVGDLALARRAGHERRVDGVDRDQIAEQADGWIHGSVAYSVSAAVSCRLSARSLSSMDLVVRWLDLDYD